MREVRLPTLIVHGDEDEIVPYAQAQAAFANCPAPVKKLETVRGGGHNDLQSVGSAQVQEGPRARRSLRPPWGWAMPTAYARQSFFFQVWWTRGWQEARAALGRKGGNPPMGTTPTTHGECMSLQHWNYTRVAHLVRRSNRRALV
eukprot:EG_transcript_12188